MRMTNLYELSPISLFQNKVTCVENSNGLAIWHYFADESEFIKAAFKLSDLKIDVREYRLLLKLYRKVVF